jgi:hypothetical protein
MMRASCPLSANDTDGTMATTNATASPQARFVERVGSAIDQSFQ